MLRHRILLGLLLVLTAGVFLADLFAVQEAALPAVLYGVPVFIAAWALPPGMVAAVAASAAAMEFSATWLQQPPAWLFAVYMFAIALFGYIGTSISARSRHEAEITARAETDRARAEAARAESERGRGLLEAASRQLQAANQQAQFERARWQAVVEGMLDPVTVCDARGRVTYINPAYARRIGYLVPPDLLLEEHPRYYRLYRPDGTLFEPEDLPLQRAALRGEELHGVEVVQRAADGREFIAVFNASPLRDAEGRIVGAVAVGRDVTEQRRAERERERLLAEQEDFVRTVSHDLRTPLTAIRGHAQLLQQVLQKAGVDDRARRSAEAVVTGAKRMNVMIQDLVDLARLESRQLKLEPVPTDVAAYAIDLKARLSTVLDADRIWVEGPEVATIALADPNRLERILTNLLSNALKYSEDRVTLGVEYADGQVRVSVADQGQGISPEDLPNLFRRFYRAGGTRKTEGLGLGLYITRMLVESQGGRIWAESEPGKGSTFSFTLPAAGRHGANDGP